MVGADENGLVLGEAALDLGDGGEDTGVLRMSWERREVTAIVGARGL